MDNPELEILFAPSKAICQQSVTITAEREAGERRAEAYHARLDQRQAEKDAEAAARAAAWIMQERKPVLAALPDITDEQVDRALDTWFGDWWRLDLGASEYRSEMRLALEAAADAK